MATPAAALAVSTPAHRPPGRHFSVVGAWVGWGWMAVGRYGVRAPCVGCCGELWGSHHPAARDRELSSSSLVVAGR
eukprot:6212722-Pleurochrysis_carterae.AAC.4